MESPSSLALATCVIVDNLEELRRLILVEKIDVNSTDSSGDTALHIAAAKGRREMVQFLIANGANVNLANNLGSTPLHKAALANQIFIVEFLVKHGADRNLKNKSGLLPEHLAHLPRIKEFLDGGQSVSEDLKIPREQHGRIIGPKGAVIRALREKTGASIIIPDKDAAGPGHITLRGRPAAVAAAKAAIYEVLATAPSLVIAEEGALNTEGSRSLPVSEGGKPSAAAAPQPRAPETTVNCPIPKEKHKKIVTAGELKKIIQETGVRVTVPSENNSDSLIKVEGTQAAVDKTVAWLYKITKDREDKGPRRNKPAASGEGAKDTRMGQTDMAAARRAILGSNKPHRGPAGEGGSSSGSGRGGGAAGGVWSGDRRNKPTREEDLASALFTSKKPEREPRRERREGGEQHSFRKGKEEKDGDKKEENATEAEAVKSAEPAKLETTEENKVAIVASEAAADDTKADSALKARDESAVSKKQGKGKKGKVPAEENAAPEPAAAMPSKADETEKEKEQEQAPAAGGEPEIIILLRSLGFAEKFQAKFRDEEIDIEAARVLSDEQLEKLGLPMGLRAKLMAALRGQAPSSPAPASPAPKSAKAAAKTEKPADAVADTASSEKKDTPKKKAKNTIPGAVPAGKPNPPPVVAEPTPVPVAAPIVEEPKKDEWVTVDRKPKKEKKSDAGKAPAAAPAAATTSPATAVAVAAPVATPQLPVVAVTEAEDSKMGEKVEKVKEKVDEWQTVKKPAGKKAAKK